MKRLFGNAVLPLLVGHRSAICYRGLLLAMSWAVLGVGNSDAQTSFGNSQPPALPTEASPGAVIQWQKPSFLPKPHIMPTVQPAIEVEEDTPKPAEEDLAAPKPVETIWIRAVVLEDATQLPQSLIEKRLATFQNRSVTFGELEALAKTLTQDYRSRGFLTSQVYIPVQDFNEGTVVLQALESKVGALHIEPGKFFSARAVRSRVQLESDEALNLDPLEFNVLDINKNPDLKVKVELKAGQTTGKTDVTLRLIDNRPYHITPFWDNLGRESIGVNRFGVLATHNNLLGFGDQFVSGVNLSKRSMGVISQYDFPIGPYGTQIGFRHAYSHLTLGGDLKDLDVHSWANVYTAMISQPIIKRPNLALTTELALDAKELRTKLLQQLFNRDQIRVLRPAVELQYTDRLKGQTTLRQEFSIGLPILSGSPNGERLGSKMGSGSQFFHYNTSLQRVQPLPLSTLSILRFNSQVSADRLLSAEQFQLGGAFTVRGYTEGRLLADKGLSTNVEWMVPSLFFPKSWKIPFTKRPLRESLYWVGFTDFGALYVNDPVPGEKKRAYLGSVGVGARLQFTRFLVGRIDLAFPLIHQFPDENRARLHFGVQSTLF